MPTPWKKRELCRQVMVELVKRLKPLLAQGVKVEAVVTATVPQRRYGYTVAPIGLPKVCIVIMSPTQYDGIDAMVGVIRAARGQPLCAWHETLPLPEVVAPPSVPEHDAQG